MNQEKEWWEEDFSKEYFPKHEGDHMDGMYWYIDLEHDDIVLRRDNMVKDISKIVAEASRRAELKAWEEMLAETKVRIKDHQIENIGDHHDAEGLTEAYHLAYKEMRGIAEDRLTHLKKL